MVRPVEATVPKFSAVVAAVCTVALTSAEVTCVIARSGDARTNPKVPTRNN